MATPSQVSETSTSSLRQLELCTRKLPGCSGGQLDAAFESAAKAYRGWKSDEGTRRDALRNAANAMFAAEAELGPIPTAEQGKPLAEVSAETIGAGVWLKYYANLEFPREVIQDDSWPLLNRSSPQ
jgi:acyl-CoA reductase-like NAD-dependent aldehyde dehydrogenase